MRRRAAAIVLGVAVDRLAGEPPTRWHPVARFGSVMGALEARCYLPNRTAGVAYTLSGMALGWAGGHLLRRALGDTAATALATATAVAGHMLDAEATKIARLLSTADVPAARDALRALVGRSTEGLSEDDIARAVIESVAENTVDAVTAAMCWALLGGAPAVLAYRAINTMDAMVGHHTERYERFGWASARLDDLANWLPARCTTLLIVGIPRPRRSQVSLADLRRQAARHPSPNGGVIEAAYAHRLGVTLGGTNRYGDRIEDRGQLGHGAVPVAGDITRAVDLRRAVTVRLAVVLVGIAAVHRSVSRARR